MPLNHYWVVKPILLLSYYPNAECFSGANQYQMPTIILFKFFTDKPQSSSKQLLYSLIIDELIICYNV